MALAALRSRGRVSKLICSNILNSVPYLYQLVLRSRLAMPLSMRVHSFSSMDGGPIPLPSERRTTEHTMKEGDGRLYDIGPTQVPPEPIPNWPLRGERLSPRKFQLSDHNEHGGVYKYGCEKSLTAANTPHLKNLKNYNNRPSRIGDDDFLEKFKLRFDKGENFLPNSTTPQLCREAEEAKWDHQATPEPPLPPPPLQDADEIFKKMKETGLIPNAVAMLDGLCKDGLVQEAMKLFGLMREKRTIPEVVIYMAAVEGFCKAQKLDDAKSIFKKMQNNGINPNAFSYTVLIQGLYKGNRLQEALDFCVEMLEADHSPNLATFTGLVDGFCREKGVEEAQSTITALRQKGIFFDQKNVTEFLDKKGPFLPLVWEAILGKKSSQRTL
ncbi:unnamed protein product [Ilex paraguariensis]|uniref:Pentatricopeptide repeat-containing protein n=1 Tax=Ilex paraguariensis TaxID=185542 RepID=A0ABC8R3E2_9AQUA